MNTKELGSLINEGNTLKSENKLEDAIEKYTEALSINLDCIPALNRLAKIYQYKQQYANEILCLEHIVKLQPDNSIVRARLAHVYLKQGRTEEAISIYQNAITDNPQLPIWAYNELGHALVQQARVNEAITIYEKAIELYPDNFRLYLQIAPLYTQTSNLDSAIKSYQQAIYQNAIADNPQLPIWVYNQLGNALSKNERVNEAIAIYEKAIELYPDDFRLYLQIAPLYTQTSNLDSAIESYQQAIKLKPDLPFHDYGTLAKALKQQGREEEAANLLNSSKEGEIYLKIWNAFNQTSLETLENESSQYPTEIDENAVRQYFKQTSQYKIINLTSLSDEDRRFLESNNISLANLKSIAQSNYNFVEQEIYLKHFNPEFKQSSKTGIELSRYPLFPFLKSMLETGYIYATCPMSGRLLRSNQSFILVPRYVGVLYRFVGDEIFYLLAGGIPGGQCLLSAIYFPSTDCIIKFLDNQYINPVPFFNHFKKWSVFHWKAVKNFLGINSNKKQLMNAVGFHFNPGHNLVNDLSSIDLLLKMKLLNKVDKFFVGNYEYSGQLEALYPEIQKDKIIRVPNSDNPHEKISEIALGNNYLSLTVRGRLVSEDLAKRIYQVSLQNCSPSFLSKVEEAKKHFPLVYISFRTHHRSWMSQVEGIANILEHLSVDFPNLGVVFDGFSLSGSYVEIKDSFVKAQIDKQKDVVKQILDLLPDKNLGVYNTVGCKMHESIIWAYAVDFYIARMGANLTKVCTLANKPGIGHCCTAYFPECQAWWNAKRENGVNPIIISGRHIIDLGKEKDINGNYDLDWKVIYDYVMKLIPQLSRNS